MCDSEPTAFPFFAYFKLKACKVQLCVQQFYWPSTTNLLTKYNNFTDRVQPFFWPSTTIGQGAVYNILPKVKPQVTTNIILSKKSCRSGGPEERSHRGGLQETIFLKGGPRSHAAKHSATFMYHLEHGLRGLCKYKSRGRRPRDLSSITMF